MNNQPPNKTTNKTKDKTTKQTAKPSRQLKVVQQFSHKPVALLPLKGKWLEQAGFTVGTEVKVVVREGCLVVLALAEE